MKPMTVPCVRYHLQPAAQPIESKEFKIGGHPALIEPIDWPRCADCGAAMQFVAQIPLQKPLELASLFDMSYLFMCPGHYDKQGILTCRTWAVGAGANEVVLQRGSECGLKVGGDAVHSEFQGTPFRVDEPDDDLAEELSDEIGDAIAEVIWEHSKVGGTPAWVQDVEHPMCPVCGGPMRYVAQIPGDLALGDLNARPDLSGVSDALERGESVELRVPEQLHHYDLGFGGVGYMFICERECSSRSAGFLWQPD